MSESNSPCVQGLFMKAGSLTGTLLELKLHDSKNFKGPHLLNIKLGIKNHWALLCARQCLNQLILNILLIVWKCKTLRAPSEYCLIRVFLFIYSVLCFHINVNKSESIAAQVLWSTYKDKAGYTNLDKPSALQSQIGPIIVRSVCNQQLKIDLDFSIFAIKFWEILSLVELLSVIPKYLTSLFTFISSIETVSQSCTLIISHFLLLIVRPEALENALKAFLTMGTWSSFWRNKQVSSASWLMVTTLSPIWMPSTFTQWTINRWRSSAAIKNMKGEIVHGLYENEERYHEPGIHSY